MTKVTNKENSIKPTFTDNGFSLLKDQVKPLPRHKPSLEILLNAPRSAAKSVLKFCNTHFLRPRRISLGIGPIGAGKSSLSEAIEASHLNPHCDTLGMEIIRIDERPLLVIDLERTQDEILEGTDRIARRIAAENNPELLTAERFKDVFIHGFLQYAKTEDKIEELGLLIEKYNPYLVILDGVASLVYDVNDTRECVSAVSLLLALADENNLSFFVTCHPNPGEQNDFKPRGVFGSELLRQAESVLLLKRAPDDRDVRILTTSFMHGKNRSGSDNLEHYFKWNDQQKMFTSCQYSPMQRIGKTESQESAFQELLDGKELRYTELTQELMIKGFCKSEATAKRWIKDAKIKGLILDNSGLYKCIIQ